MPYYPPNGTVSALTLSGNTVGASTVGNAAGVVIAGGNNITLSVNAGTLNIVGGAGGAGDGVNIIAAGGSTANTTGTIVFSNSNGVSFGLNGSVVTASVQAGAAAGIGAAAAGTQTQTSGTLNFANSNGISFGMSNSSQITASYTVPTQTVQTQNSVQVQGSSGNVVFSNSNNITFGFNASTITASASFSQSTAPAVIAAGTTSATSGTVSFSNANGVSFGMNAGTITASYTVPTQSVQTQGSVQVQGSTGAITFANANNITFGFNASTITASASYSQSTGPSGFAAGTQTGTSGTLNFVNSNGISFGLSGSSQITASYTVPSQSNQTEGIYAIGNTTGQSSSSTYDARTWSVSGGGIVSVGNSGGSFIISASTSQSVQTQNSVQVQGSSGNVVFSNSNNVSFGFNASTITASASFSQSTGPSAFAAGTQTGTSGTLNFANSNGISFGLSGSSQITASYTVPNVPAQTNQTIGLYAVSNTTGQSSSSTFDARSITFQGAGVASVGYSNGSVVISVPSGGGAGDGVNIIAAGTQTANTTGTVLFQNSNGISFGLSNFSVLTASYTVPTQSVQTEGVYAVGNTTGQSSSSTYDARTFSFSGAGIVSVGNSGGSFIISASTSQSVQTQNSVQVLGSSGNISFANSNGITFGANANTITASVGAGATATGNFGAIGAGTQTATSGTIAFANSNGISFGMSGSSQITASYTVPTQSVQTYNVIAAGTQTANTSGSVVFSNSNNVSFGMNNSSIVTASFSQSVQTQGSVQVQGSSGNVVFSNSNNITFGFNASTITASASYSQSTGPSAFAAGTQTGTSGTLNFVNSNGISFGLSGSSQITASYTVPNIPAQTDQTIGLYAVGNTTGQSSSSTFDARTLSFSGAGIASVGYSAGNVIISVPAGGGGGDGYNIIAVAGSTAALSTTVLFSNANSVSFGLNGGTLTASFNDIDNAIAAGTQTFSSNASGTLVFANSNGVTFGMSNNSVITASVNAGGAAFTGSWWEPEIWGNTLTSSHANGTLFIRPVELDGYYDGDMIQFQQSYASVSSTMSISASVSAGSASSGSGTWGQTGTVLWFSRLNTNETNASYNSIQTFQSNTYSMSAGYSVSVSWSTNVSSATASFTTSAAVGFIKNIDGGGGVTTSATTSSSSSSFSSTSTNANSFSSSFQMNFPYVHMSGIRPLFVPLAGSNVTPGEYWIGMIQSTTTGSTNYSLNRVAMMTTPGMLYFTGSTNSYAEIGNSVFITTSNYRPGFGSYSASTQTTTAIPLSQISTQASNGSLWLAVIGKTL